jgi:hypothetical protein
MRIVGKIQAFSFKEGKVAVKLEGARFLTQEQTWKEWVDWDDKTTKKGEIWISSFDDAIYQACRELEKGQEIDATVLGKQAKSGKTFWNIKNIGLKIPERDVKEDMPPEPDWSDMPEERDPDSPESQIEEMVESATLDMPDKDILIIRQTCIKAASNVAGQGDAEGLIFIARKLEKYVLGK